MQHAHAFFCFPVTCMDTPTYHQDSVCDCPFSPSLHFFLNPFLFPPPFLPLSLPSPSLQDGVIHPTDTSLRDFSALCVKEFLVWSIKQTTKKQQEKSPINTKSLLKRLYSLASHPSAAKRLGAALTFNSIYTVFRSE